MVEPTFRRETLLEIIAFVERRLAAGEPIELRVLDPDLGRGRYAGELVDHAGETYVHRPLRVWLDLAERLGLRLGVPRGDGGLVRLRFEPLDRARRLRGTAEPTERYGAGSEFARIDKLEDPGFAIDLRDALDRARLGPRPAVLELGVNTGAALAMVAAHRPGAALTGIDHSPSALAVARERLPGARLIEADLAALDHLDRAGLGRFDLALALSTLQSPGLDDRALLRRIVQHHLTPGGAVILGLPNCRYVDGEVEYGARMKNFAQPELGLLVKDVAFYRKYLQQHHRQVFVTGKHYVLVTGVARTEGDPAGD